VPVKKNCRRQNKSAPISMQNRNAPPRGGDHQQKSVPDACRGERRKKNRYVGGHRQETLGLSRTRTAGGSEVSGGTPPTVASKRGKKSKKRTKPCRRTQKKKYAPGKSCGIRAKRPRQKSLPRCCGARRKRDWHEGIGLWVGELFSWVRPAGQGECGKRRETKWHATGNECFQEPFDRTLRRH